MARISLIVADPDLRRMVHTIFSDDHFISDHRTDPPLENACDLYIIDDDSLPQFRSALEDRRRAERPAFLPVLLITKEADAWVRFPSLWEVADEAVLSSAGSLELQSRVETLLRARAASHELKLRNEDLEAFIQAMSHDLRASLRAVTMFADAIVASENERLSEQAKQDLDRIRLAGQEMTELIESLLNFSRLGRSGVRYEPIHLRSYIQASLRGLQPDIEKRNARMRIRARPRVIQADPALLKIALTNLVSNALKFVPEGVQPEITISASIKDNLCRIEVDDNGIGIQESDQQRIFLPFVRLYSDQVFPGLGLGLPSARKAVELMGGRAGVESRPGQGSRFWIELAA